jgi:hypothetical protein
VKRSWRLRRQTSPSPDGQHRWIQAYQLLLQWTTSNELLNVGGDIVSTFHTAPAALPAGAYQEDQQEDHHAHRPLSSGLDPATSPPADE